MKSSTYWQDKISVYLHDPICKVFDIQHHETIAKEIAEKLVQTEPNKDVYSVADRIASGLTRAAVPGYSADSKLNGAINITESPFVTHPLVREQALKLDLPSIDIASLKAEIKQLLADDLGIEKTFDELQSIPHDERPLNGLCDRNTRPEEWAESLFNYLFFAFPRRLRNQNIGKLGSLWDVLPADTRIPDHPLWHHLGLTSALASSMGQTSESNVSMVVFSITPVQDFISKARKLRDYWTGSVLLSYLSFVGISVVMKELGSDHVIYPSLHNQFLVDQWLGKEFNLAKYLTETNESLNQLNAESSSIASFPNKFVFICNQNDVDEICSKITQAIQTQWIETSQIVKRYIANSAGIHDSDIAFSDIWNKAIDDYWKYSWAASNLAKLSELDSIKALLTEQKWKEEYETLDAFKKAFSAKNDVQTARLYGATHSLVQGVLASSKTKPINIHKSQNGEKCPLCGEHEVLSNFTLTKNTKASDYNKATQAFWNIIRERTNGDDGFSQTGEHERLCAVCATKRFLSVALKVSNNKNHLLFKTLAKSESFPSTTEMAAFNQLKNEKSEEDKKAKIQQWHNSEFLEDDLNALSNKDKYYAVLLMDGDKMGDLINGQTIDARWKDVLSPDLVKRFENTSFCVNSPFKEKSFIEKTRTINPALHAMISDSLNSFARYSVQPTVKQASGRLIYAGGDDVCAILPLSTVLDAANQIRKAYTLSFAKIDKTGSVLIENAKPKYEKIAMYLGSGAKGISLSGGIIIAHHKQPLKEVLLDAHYVLDKIAKDKSGRNSIALRLKKRSGGDRDTWFKWDESNIFSENKKTCFESFCNIIEAAKNKQLSVSLLYKIESLKAALTPAIQDFPQKKETLIRLFEYEIKHSGIKIDSTKARELAIDLAGICIKTENGHIESECENWFNPEAAIIANFMAGGDNE